jgi:hypothetical protein
MFLQCARFVRLISVAVENNATPSFATANPSGSGLMQKRLLAQAAVS